MRLLEGRGAGGSPLLIREVLGSQLVECRFGLSELEAHPREHAIRLRELDLVVLHDLDAVAARIAEVEAGPKQLDTGLLESLPDRPLVVDDEPEVRFVRPRAAFEQGEELVSQLQEGRMRLAAIDCRRLEQVGVERDRLLDVVHLQRNVIDPYETWLHARVLAAGRSPR